MKYVLFILIFYFFHHPKTSFGQDNLAVNLKKIEAVQSDTSKVNLYLELMNEYFDSDPELAIELGENAQELCENIDFKSHRLYSSLTGLYIHTSQYKKATDCAFLLVEKTKSLNGNEKYDFEGRAHERLSTIYNVNGNYDLAIKYQKQAIESYKKLKNDNSYLTAYINLANLYLDQEKIETALKHYRFAEANLEKENLSEYFPYVYNGIAICFQYKNEIDQAISYYEKSKQSVLRLTPDDHESLAITYNNIGNLQNDIGQYLSAVINLSEALELFKDLGDRKSVSDVYYNLALTYTNLKRFELSNSYMLKYMELKDSIFDAETKETIHDLSIKYDAEKKEQENKLLAKENEKKQQSIYFALAGLILVMAILFIIFRNSRVKSKINKELEEKNSIIEEKSNLVEEQNKDITDSIRYAQRIQAAILPPEDKWLQVLPNSSIYYRPKDILSGDFYWVAETDTHKFVAAADCTGHGVPGALMSIINYNLLNKAVLEKGIVKTGEILDAVNTWLTESLHQTVENTTIKDGMDISLISIDKKSQQICFTGANNPLYLFNSDGFREFKGDKFPVGSFVGEELRNFKTQEIETKEGDFIYLFTDGYADQFGGPRGKKFKYKQLRETFQNVYPTPLTEQKEKLNRTFEVWMGELDQIDDVLIIGLKF